MKYVEVQRDFEHDVQLARGYVRFKSGAVLMAEVIVHPPTPAKVAIVAAALDEAVTLFVKKMESVGEIARSANDPMPGMAGVKL